MKLLRDLIAKLQEKAIEGLLSLLAVSPLISLPLWEDRAIEVVSAISQPWLTRLLFLLLVICLLLGTLLIYLFPKLKYVEEAGALFKKNPDGTYNKTPYCPSCKTAMVSPSRHELFRCGKASCGQMASFDSLHRCDVLERLP